MGGLEEMVLSRWASDIGDEEGVPMEPNPAVDALVNAGLAGISNMAERGEERGVLKAS